MKQIHCQDDESSEQSSSTHHQSTWMVIGLHCHRDPHNIVSAQGDGKVLFVAYRPAFCRGAHSNISQAE